MESTAAARLPEPLSRFNDLYPEVQVELRTSDPRSLASEVLAGELDAALVAEPVSDHRLETQVIYDEELVIIAGAKHPPITSPRSIPDRTVLAFHPGCPHRSQPEEWFAKEDVPITPSGSASASMSRRWASAARARFWSGGKHVPR